MELRNKRIMTRFLYAINHKGQQCPFRKWLFCQEGVCAECQIYLAWEKEHGK